MFRPFAIFVLLGLGGVGPHAEHPIVAVDVVGVVHPITVEIFARALDQANRQNAVAVLVRLNTPGGMPDSARQIVEKILASPVPVVTYVTPITAGAASAGFIVLEGGDVAAMAPGTHAGAAHPPILGLSTTGGFQFMLEDRTGGSVQDLAQAADLLVQSAGHRGDLANVISTFRPNVPAYNVDMDLAKIETLGIPVTDAYNTLQTFLGGLYVNDFNAFGRTWQVVVQAEPEFRSQPADINRFYARTNDGSMVPLGTLSTVRATAGPDVVYRYNRFRAIQILGGPAPGFSSGQASNAMEEVAASALPSGYGYEWTGTTYQQKEAQGHEAVIFGFAGVLVFLFLAVLYESWSIPFAVLMALPLGLFGALLAVWLRSYPYDIYTQIGIVTLIGLAAKNAILIVEFARMTHEGGRSIAEAALEAARLRLPPILMTSFAFILGVTPLLIAHGAGGASRRSLGTAVFGGMNAATLLAIFIVPVLYVGIQRVAERGRKPAAGIEPVAEPAK